MELLCHSSTHIGLVRAENQDAVLADQAHRLFIVADGMGGHQGGKTASNLAIQATESYLKKALHQPHTAFMPDVIKKAYGEANRLVYERGLQSAQLQGMGTTMCLFTIQEDGMAYIGNVGDSRLYMLKDNTLWQLTEDHTLQIVRIKTHISLGEKILQNAFADDRSLTKSVGFSPIIEPDIMTKKVEKGELYLICSDGLSCFVPTKSIQDILISHKGAERVKACIDSALKTGGLDNISVIVVEIL